MKELSPLIISIVKQFSEKYVKDENTWCIFIVGSYTTGTVDNYSDIDVYIIQGKSDTRTRGNTWINGLEIEYFINPIDQVHSYLDNEPIFRPVTATMLNDGFLLYQKENQQSKDDIKAIISKAKQISDTQIDPLSEYDKELAKYTIDDYIKNFKGSAEKSNILSMNYIKNKLLMYLTEIFFKIHRVRFPTDKNLSKIILHLDNRFYYLLLESLNLDSTHLYSASDYIESLLGGKREKEWILTTDLDLE